MHSPQRVLVFADSPVTVAPGDRLLIVNAVGGPVVINIPTGASKKGRFFEVIKTDASANAVTITPGGGQTVNGGATLAITTQWQTVGIVSIGPNYIGTYGAVGTGGGGGASALDIFYKDFFSQAGMLPPTVYKEELYTFPAKDWEVNLGPGSAPTHALLQSRDRIVGTGNTDYRFGWDTGALRNKMLFIVGGLRARGFTVGAFITPLTSLVGTIVLFDSPFGAAGIEFAGPGGSDGSADYNETNDTRNREMSYAIYYSKVDQIVRGFVKFGAEQWWPIGSYTADEGQMRYAGIRVVPAGTERYNAVCPLIVRYG
jgi:hypothetical protein